MENIKKVIVVHKTHLDIGFTDSAEAVLHRYMETFIPGAIATARECNQNGEKNFVWTVGSFLIELYLERGQNPDLLVQAIQDGDIVWHGLPLTTHTELMDGKLFQYGLSISQRLDKRFGRHTIAAKMTDVPSHTHAVVPYLAKAGIKYFHVGINGSSKMVKLPPLCRLRYGEDEVILDYAALYGAVSVCGDCAMEFAHTPDNSGPPCRDGAAAAEIPWGGDCIRHNGRIRGGGSGPPGGAAGGNRGAGRHLDSRGVHRPLQVRRLSGAAPPAG